MKTYQQIIDFFRRHPNKQMFSAIAMAEHQGRFQNNAFWGQQCNFPPVLRCLPKASARRISSNWAIEYRGPTKFGLGHAGEEFSTIIFFCVRFA
jgi:hypothetical protein